MTPLPSYDLLTPRKIVFGNGRRAEIDTLAASLGARAFLGTGSRTLESHGIVGEIVDRLQSADLDVVRLGSIDHEPEVDDVDRLVEEIRKHAPAVGDFVIALGGGSAIDLAKATAALATNGQSATVKDYLEGVGRGLQLTEAPLPMLAVPTTAGTGTEATKNAVISSYDPPFKKSLRSERMVPDIVLVDPELAVTLPPATTAHTGMDAITQLIESYISRRARPIPQALALHGLELAVPAIATAVEDGGNLEARGCMAHAALLSGIALANSGLGFAHGVAPALGVHNRVPHGLACAVMLPMAMRVNRHARLPELARIGRLITANNWRTDEAAADAGIERIVELCERISIPSTLTDLGVRPEQIPALVASSRGNSMSANPCEVSDAELTEILESML